jgi:hypothetical protein
MDHGLDRAAKREAKRGGVMEHWLHFKRETVVKMARRRQSVVEQMTETRKARPLTDAERDCMVEAAARFTQLTRFLIAVTTADAFLNAIRLKSFRQNGGKTQGG